MLETPCIYLDNAATSWPKPDAVYAAVDACQRESGVAVGRGATRRGAALQAIVDRCRRRAAALLGATAPESVAFMFNGTDALNTAIHGVLRPGDHVVTTSLEHNSVLRPLSELAARMGVDVTYVSAVANGAVTVDDVRAALRPATRLVAINHASNVTGAVQPVAEIAIAVREAGVLVLVDAAQTAGHLSLDVTASGIDLLACSGHKGLLGPLGTGLLYVRPEIADRVRSLRQGGTGSRSEEDRQPASLPDRFESGNHNAPGLVGLDAALGWIEEQGITALRSHDQRLTSRLFDRLATTPGVRLYGPEDPEARVGIVCFNIDGFDPQITAAILDDQFGIEVRAGLHCAPRVHRDLGTLATGGTVRMSVGPFTTEAEIDAAADAVQEIAGAV